MTSTPGADARVYAIVIEPLPSADGGGFLASVPDLLGCTGDGETEAEAIADAREAILAWIDTAEALGRTVPPPAFRLAGAD